MTTNQNKNNVTFYLSPVENENTETELCASSSALHHSSSTNSLTSTNSSPLALINYSKSSSSSSQLQTENSSEKLTLNHLSFPPPAAATAPSPLLLPQITESCSSSSTIHEIPDDSLITKSTAITTTSTASVAINRRTTRGKQKIPIEFMHDKMRRSSCFAKRKQGLMKKAYEISELTGAEVLVMIASPTDHVYTFHTPKFRSLIESPEAKSQIEACIRGDASAAAGGIPGGGGGGGSSGSATISSNGGHLSNNSEEESVFGVERTLHFGASRKS